MSRPFQACRNIFLLSQQLDEKLANLHLPALGATLVVSILEQAVCMGVKIDVLDSIVRMRSHSLNDGICERN